MFILRYVSHSKTFNSSGIYPLLACISGLIGQWNSWGGGGSFTPRSLRKLDNELVSRVADSFICVKTEAPRLRAPSEGDHLVINGLSRF